MGRTTLFLFLLFLIQRASGQSGPVVQTQNGAVQGTFNYTLWESKQYSAFKGIPYAEPPVGRLRFKPPVPIGPWNGTLDATQHGSICPQLVVETQEIQGNEDCLTLNVYTPDTNFTGPLVLKPVLLWIHGGGYKFGHSNYTLYGPDFVVRHDVLMVSFNYRLGPFGFLALDHQDALGNAGLKDQYLVLQWVQKNIAAFGGDPNQVTIFGESAGGSSVGFHVLSDKAKGLFSKAVYLSGVPLCPWAHHSTIEAHQNAYNLGLVLGHVSTSNDDLLNFLLNASTMSLLNGSLLLDRAYPFPFRPTIENVALDYNNTAYVTKCSMAKYKSGNFSKVPTLMGYMHDETLLFLSRYYSSLPNITAQGLVDFTSSVDPLAASVMSTALNYSTEIVVDVAVKVTSDLIFIAGIDLTQELLAANNGNNSIYYYRQSYGSKNPWHKVVAKVPYDGVAHFDDIPYIFNMDYIPPPTDPNDPDYQNINRTTTMITNFAKYGDPTPLFNNPLNIVWTPSGPEGLQIDLNTTSTMRTSYEDASVILYKKILSETCY